jgi:circadian clock protein KaiC
MLGGRGFFRGASVLVSGSAGTGKSSIVGAFVSGACRRGERALLFAYEESKDQILRNARSIGLDLARWVAKGQLEIHTCRPTLLGLEEHLWGMHETVAAFRPAVVAVDPITNLSMDREDGLLKPMLMRLIDLLKQKGITAMFTSLTTGGSSAEASQVGVSSLMDAWLLLRNHECNGERNRTIFVLKSRGMAHSNQVREFILCDEGIHLVDVYLGTEGVLTGTARLWREATDQTAQILGRESHERRIRRSVARDQAIQGQISELRAQLEAEAAERRFLETQEAMKQKASQENAEALARLRGSPQGRVKK